MLVAIPETIVVFSFGSFLLYLAYNSIWNPTVEWTFLLYFDDVANFLTHKDAQTLMPLSINQVSKVLSVGGINVFEPVGNLLKAVQLDLIGYNPQALRLTTLGIHTLNSFAICIYAHMLTSNLNIKLTKTRYYHTSLAITSLVFALHPINTEVVCWLSAQNYSFALLFSLVSSMCLEISIEKSSKKYFFFSLLLYFVAVLTKAPAIMVGIVHVTRVIMSTKTTQWARDLLYVAILFMAFFSAFHIIHAANSDSNSEENYEFNLKTIFSSTLGPKLIAAKLIKASKIMANFALRLIVPTDLRVHYRPENLFDYVSSITPYSPTITSTAMMSTTLIVIAISIAHPNLCFSLLAYVLLWAPGLGFVSHGWNMLGADRYCYLPLAYLTPTIVVVIISLFEAATNDEFTKISVQLNRIRLFAVIAAVLILLSSYALQTKRMSLTWQNDAKLLFNCIEIDPFDWECLDYQAQLTGHVSGDYSSASNLTQRVINALEDSKSYREALFRSKLLLFTDGSPTCCNAVDSLYDTYLRDEYRSHVRKEVRVMLMNDIAFCHIVRNGINQLTLQTAKQILLQELESFDILRKRKRYERITSSFQNHLNIIAIIESGHTIEYSVPFLW